MTALLSGIMLEALAGLTKKLRRHAQVHLRGLQMNVTEIDRQVMQESLYVGTLLIPGGETVNGEGVPQVVNPRLLACVSPTDACAITQKSELQFQPLYGDGAARLGREKRGIRRPSSWPSAIVLNQDLV
jgi:hypothetical protein